MEVPSKAANTLETDIATDCAGTRQSPNKGAKSQDCSKVKLQNKLKRSVTFHNIHRVKDPIFRILHNLHSIDDSDCIMHFYAWHISYPGLCIFMFLFVFHYITKHTTTHATYQSICICTCICIHLSLLKAVMRAQWCLRRVFHTAGASQPLDAIIPPLTRELSWHFLFLDDNDYYYENFSGRSLKRLE